MKPWLLSLAMDLASASMISGGARLSQRAAVHAALDLALQQGSVASLHRMQVQSLATIDRPYLHRSGHTYYDEESG